MKLVTLYTRPACAICRDAEDLLRQIGKTIRFELEIVNIDENSSAHEKYWDRIPIITVDGIEVAGGTVDGGHLYDVLASR